MAPNPLQQLQDITSRKKIYFIRHGESVTNAGPVRQGDSSSLTEKGKSQAAFMAERCFSLPIEALIASTQARAMETAAIIGEKIGKTVDHSPLFRERRRPSIQNGKSKNDPVSMEADAFIEENFGKSTSRHSDEETFQDLKDRALAALEYLESRPEEHIAVVTHGFFMRIVIACAVYGKDLTGEEGRQFVRAFHMQNTALSILGFDGKEAKTPWWIWVWNDHAHLAE